MKVFFASVAVVSVLLVAGCGKDDKAAVDATKAAASAPKKLAPAEVQLKDFAENVPNYLVAVSYDPAVGQYKGLADLAEGFANDAVKAFKDKVASSAPATDISKKPTLSLNFTSISNTPQFAAVTLNGSEFTAGTSATPILKRWVWLPSSKSEVTVAQMFPSAQAAINARGAGGKLVGMEPIANADGRISSIYFVFSKDGAEDAVDKVVMKAEELKPLADAKYRSLFAE